MIAVVNYADEGQASRLKWRTPFAGRLPTLSEDTSADAFATRQISYIPNSSFRQAPIQDDSHDISAIDAIENGHHQEPAVPPVVGLPAHLMRMCRTPLLSAEEETAMFRRMNLLKYRANVLQTSIEVEDADPDQLNQLEDLLKRADRIRNHLIQSNIRLVMSIAKSFADVKNTFDDLLSEGISSLMHAVEKFDYDRGYRFSTYATRAIRRDLYRLVVRGQKQRQRFATGSDDLFASRPGEPENLGMTELEADSTYSKIQAMLENLDSRERMIVRARFGFDTEGARKTTYTKLAKQLGISKERVRQLAERAITKLRRMVPEVGLDGLSS
jgi:RNA polymerase sigma factor (sigma-70 family)